MEKYFNEAKITERSLQILNGLERKYPMLVDNSALFAGFPFFSNENGEKTIDALLVSLYGIIVFYSNENDIGDYKSYVIQQLLSSSSISKVINFRFDSFVFCATLESDLTEYLKENKFSGDDVLTIVSIFHKIHGLKKKDSRGISREGTIGAAIVARSQTEANLDKDQFNFIYDEKYTNVNVRIRGLAGSGKTILLAEKMAYTHFKSREKKIACVFYTKSLKQTIDRFFDRFYKETSNGMTPDKERIDIMHAWGSYYYPGLYYNVCKMLGYDSVAYSEQSDFAGVCQDLILRIQRDQKEENIRLYDYLLVDEAQDFPLSFFKLARMCLKHDGKLIYAYDELQNLNAVKTRIPNKTEIFGSDVCRDIDLSKCYRNSKEILVTAHALGLGIYHTDKNGDRELINAVQDKTVWQATGYLSFPKRIVEGQEVTLSRETVIQNPLGDNAISYECFDSFRLQAEKVIAEIANLIKNEDVFADDILIIDLDSIHLNGNYSLFEEIRKSIYPDNQDGKSTSPFCTGIINKDSGTQFKLKGKVTYTTIFRAKGNESNIVFVINSNMSDAILSYNRNRLFTAMTRAKIKVYIYCVGKSVYNTLEKEIEMVRNNNYLLKFVYPTKEEIDKCKNKVYAENQRVEKAEALIKTLDEDEMFDAFYSGLSESQKELFRKKIYEKEKEGGGK